MSLIGVTIISSQMDGVAKLSADTPAVLKKISALETENKTFKKGMYVFTWMYLQYLCMYLQYLILSYKKYTTISSVLSLQYQVKNTSKLYNQICCVVR